MRTEIFHALPEQAKQIRITVFMDEQGFMQEFDALDGLCTHLLGYDGDRPIATCRIWQANDGWHVGRIAVIQSHRGRGLGTQMLASAEQYVKSQGGTALSLHAQCRAEGFYRQCGYVPFGEIDDDEGVPHVYMKKEL